MKQPLLLLLTVGILSLAVYYFRMEHFAPLTPAPAATLPANAHKPGPAGPKTPAATLKATLAAKVHRQALHLKSYAARKGFSTRYCFLLDMSLPSGKNRFFIYDLGKDSIVLAGLATHGSCNTGFLHEARFSNTPNQGCSSLGKYKIGHKYNGRFGAAYKLHGLDSTNSNAFRRYVVLHGYDCVPDEEIYPNPLCNSLGCPMVSYAFLDKAARVIDQARRPVLLWVY